MDKLYKATQFSDPITFEVFKNGSEGLANEMALVMTRTAHSPIAHSGLDFSMALCDEHGHAFAQGNAVLLHLGTITDVVQTVVSRFKGRIYPGDSFLLNAEHSIGQHLPDIYAVRPCFHADTLVGFAVCMSHHNDVGGAAPGSMSPFSTEIYQEGLMIPLVKLYERGELNEPLRTLMMHNVRTPDLFWGDLQGQLSACRRGEIGLSAMAERYGVEGLRTLIAELLDYTDRRTRATLAAVPDGSYSFEDRLDDDYAGNGPVALRVCITIRGDSAVVDWTGTDPQVPSAVNNPFANTLAISYGALRCALGSDIPANQGFYRPIKVIAPAGTIVNPNWPAARAGRGVTAARMMDTMLGALTKALPDRVCAAGAGGTCFIRFVGLNDAGEKYFTTSPSGWGAWGARPGLDGIEGGSNSTGNIAFFSIEETESAHGIRVERHEFLKDSAGPGRWRGSPGIVTDMRLLGDQSTAAVRYGRRDIRPYGLAGGQPGGPASIVVNPGGADEKCLAVADRANLKRGDLVRHTSPGGGGFGDPRQRDRAAVIKDVRSGRVSIEQARSVYGMELRADELETSN